MPKDATAYLGCTIDPIVQGMEKRIRRDGTSLYLTQECPGIGLLHEKPEEMREGMEKAIPTGREKLGLVKFEYPTCEKSKSYAYKVKTLNKYSH